MYLSWDSAITQAAPVMKPVKTLPDRKFVRNPKRHIPRIHVIMLAKRERFKQKLTYSGEDSMIEGASRCIVVESKRHVIAIGPIEMCLLVPNAAYKMRGTVLEYSP